MAAPEAGTGTRQGLVSLATRTKGHREASLGHTVDSCMNRSGRRGRRTEDTAVCVLGGRESRTAENTGPGAGLPGLSWGAGQGGSLLEGGSGLAGPGVSGPRATQPPLLGPPRSWPESPEAHWSFQIKAQDVPPSVGTV